MYDVRYLQLIVDVLTKTLSLVYSLGNIFAIKVVIMSRLLGLCFRCDLFFVYSETKPDGIMLSGFFIFKTQKET